MQNSIDVTNLAEISSYIGKTVIEEASDNRYIAKIVQTPKELEAVLRLRFDVFKRELSSKKDLEFSQGIDFDEYDLTCEHLIVFEKATQKAVGTYRINSIESAKSPKGFYAFNEFHIEDLPNDILNKSIEIGRACIAKEHRNTKVLFLLWKGLANYLKATNKRYLFGCCSIFTQDKKVATKILKQFEIGGHLHETIKIAPRKDRVCIEKDFLPDKMENIKLPILVNIYLRIGAKVCGEPAIDREFKTVDFFVIFDIQKINKKYGKMFFGT